MYPGYLALGQGDPRFDPLFTELVNNGRAYAYARKAGLTWLQECTDCPETQTVVPGSENGYVGVAEDPAPWFDFDNPDTEGFLGVIGIEVVGDESSTRNVAVNNALTIGGVIGPPYFGPRTLVVRLLAIAEDECSLQAGLDWLRFSSTGMLEPCLGDDLTFFDCCPCVCHDDAPGGPCWARNYQELMSRPTGIVTSTFGMPALGTGGGTPTPLTATGRWHVEGRDLITPSGLVYPTINGVETGFWNEFGSPTRPSDLPARILNCSNGPGKGINAIRMLFYRGDAADPAPTPDAEPATASFIHDTIMSAVNAGVPVDVGLSGGKVPAAYNVADVKAVLLSLESNILGLHVLGESYATTGPDWEAEAIAAVLEVRGYGYTCPLTVMSNYGGRNIKTLIDHGAAVLAADPLHNVWFGWQGYWGGDLDDNAPTDYYQNLSGGMSWNDAVAACAASPFRIQNGNCSEVDFIVTMPLERQAACVAAGVGTLWWSWDITASIAFGNDAGPPYGSGIWNNSTATPGEQLVKQMPYGMANADRIALPPAPIPTSSWFDPLDDAASWDNGPAFANSDAVVVPPTTPGEWWEAPNAHGPGDDPTKWITVAMKRHDPTPGTKQIIEAQVEKMWQFHDPPDSNPDHNLRTIVKLMAHCNPQDGTLEGGSFYTAQFMFQTGGDASSGGGTMAPMLTVSIHAHDGTGAETFDTQVMFSGYPGSDFPPPETTEPYTLKLESYQSGRQIVSVNGVVVIDAVTSLTVPRGDFQAMSLTWDTQFEFPTDPSIVSPRIMQALGSGEVPTGGPPCFPDFWPATYGELITGPPEDDPQWCAWVQIYRELTIGPNSVSCCVDSCIVPYLRQYHNAAITQGPTVLQHPSMSCGAMAELEMTIVAATPDEVTLPGRRLSLSLNPAMAVPYDDPIVVDDPPPDPFPVHRSPAVQLATRHLAPLVATPTHWLRVERPLAKDPNGSVLTGLLPIVTVIAHDHPAEQVRFGLWAGDDLVAGFLVPFVPANARIEINGVHRYVRGFFGDASRQLNGFVKHYDGGLAKWPDLSIANYRLTVDQEVGKAVPLEVVVQTAYHGAG